MDQPKHIPVLLEEVIKLLEPKPSDRYLDLTAGYGGHAREVADRIGKNGSLTLVDRDENAVNWLRKDFKATPNKRIVHSDFLSASKILKAEGAKFDVILADLGISSPHIDNPERGFSVVQSGPLDMRMDSRLSTTAADIVNTYSEEQLAHILRKYGEVKKAHILANKIVQSRPIEETTELANLIISQSKFRKRSINPATQVFQALRIVVNDELKQLEASLPIWIDLLAAGGRLGVISFHSLEDRLVKQAFKSYGGERYDATLQTVTKRPVTAGSAEIVFNPRARSAKLRVAQRK